MSVRFKKGLIQHHARIFVFELNKPPSWTDASLLDVDLRNKEYHTVVLFELGQYFGIYCSSKDIRERIRTEILESNDDGAPTPVPISKLFRSFVNDDDVRMLWLSNTAGKSRIKPGSKAIIGDGLADALDPMDDQSYAMSAVRTTADFGVNETRAVGLNPYKSMIWCGQCNSWEKFSQRVYEILDHLNTNVTESDSPISILAYPLNNLDGVGLAYEFSVAEADLFEEEESTLTSNLARLIAAEYTYELESDPITGKTRVRVYHQGKDCGSVVVELSVEQYKVTFDNTLDAVNGKKGKLKNFCRVFNYPEMVKIWFESGHTMLNGMVFKTELKDMPFNNFLWCDFGETKQALASHSSVTFKEKPTKIRTDNQGEKKELYDVTAIGKQKTLFCWVSKNWHSEWGTVDEFSQTMGGKDPSGWIYCDDGPGENADFIHIGEYKGQQVLTFIHIKSVKKPRGDVKLKNRKLSVGAHDVVVNQAIKNIRYCERKNLIEAIKEKIAKSQTRRVWHNGDVIENGETAFLKQAEGLNASHLKRVIIIQPHTLRSIYHTADKSKVKLQLNTLFLTAQRAANSNNAEFYVVGTEWSGEEG